MKIQVYQCRFTGKQFKLSEKQKYLRHLQELRVQFQEARYTKQVVRDFASWFQAEKEKISAIDMIVPWILENQKILMAKYNLTHTERWNNHFDVSNDKFEKITISRIYYSDCVSNTHSCPRNGVENWGGKEGLPTGYPGYIGRIDACLIRPKKLQGRYPTSDFLKMIDLHTGSGGGGNENSSWDVKIFLADWPELAQSVLMQKLKGSA